MYTKLSAWIILGASLATVLWSTWPRTVATPVKARAPFAAHQSQWMDSVLATTSDEDLLRQRLALWVPGADSSYDPVQIASLVNRYQVGSVWFQDLSHETLAEYLRLIRRQPGIDRMIGLLPSAATTGIPAVVNGSGLAGLNSVSGIAPYANALSVGANELGIQAIGLPSLTNTFNPAHLEPLQYPATLLAQELASHNIHPILTGTGSLMRATLADSLQKPQILASLKAWTKVPVSAWLLDEPMSEGKAVTMDDLVRILRQDLGFEGMVIARLGSHATPQGTQAAIVRLLTSGVDLVMAKPHELELLSETEDKMVKTGTLRRRDFDAELRQVVQAKSWNRPSAIDSMPATPSPLLQWQGQAMLEQQFSILQTENGPVPVKNLMDRTVHVVGMGLDVQPFVAMLRRYFPVSTSNGYLKDPWLAMSSIRLAKYDPLILVFGTGMPAQEEILFWNRVKELGDKVPVLLVNLGDPARVEWFPENVSVLQGYDAGPVGQEVAAQMVAGGLPVTGRFPLNLNSRLFVGAEGRTSAVRLAYGPSEAVGLDSRLLQKIDSITWEGISELAMPGAQILVAKNGRVIYDKSFGYHTYLKRRGVYPTDLYDIASMTKVMATTLAAMSMTEQGKLELDVPISRYFRNPFVWRDSADLEDTVYFGLLKVEAPTFGEDSAVVGHLVVQGKAQTDTTFLEGDSILVTKSYVSGRVRRSSPALSASVAELMTHTSGLPAGLNLREFYRGKTVWRNNRQYFSVRSDSLHRIPVARDLYLRSDMADSIWASMMGLRRQDSAGYRYSDVNMILVQRVIDSINQERIDQYLDRNWFKPLGLQHTTFRPTERYDLDRIVPTEYDRRYRNQTLQGYVHDPTAALLGGISGNAGLFSTADELAVIAQMWLNDGRYGGKQWLKPETVRAFTRASAGHRGLGFDKPPKEGPYLIAPSASPNSFGHTGYTGTLFWVDPDEDLVFIFLSNRVHPRANNWLLNQLNIRQRIHEVVYEAIRAAAGEEGV